MLRLSEMRKLKKMSSFWEARFALIGQLSSTLWLAKYLKRETEMLLPLPFCDAVLQTESTTLRSSKLTFESSVAHFLNKKTYLQAVSQKHQTVLEKL